MLLPWMQANLSRPLVIQPYHVREANIIAVFDALFFIEIATTVSGMALSATIVVYRKHLNVHINLRYIMLNTAVQYVVFAPSRFVSIGFTMDWDRLEPMEYCLIFRAFDTLRNQYVLVGAFLLPAAVFERMCSNAYLYDYEQTPRKYISFWVIVVQNIIAFGLAFTMVFVGVVHVIVPYILVAITNILAIVGCIHCHKVTMQYYRNMLENVYRAVPRPYSLSARFQVVENIRVEKLLMTVFTLVSLLVGFLIGALSVAMLCRDMAVSSFATEAFLIGVAIYANFIPGVFLYHVPGFREDLRRLLSCFRRVRAEVEHEAIVKSCVNGARLSYSPEEEAKLHFSQMDKMWS